MTHYPAHAGNKVVCCMKETPTRVFARVSDKGFLSWLVREKETCPVSFVSTITRFFSNG